MYALKKLQVFEGQRTEIAHQDIICASDIAHQEQPQRTEI